MSTVLQAYQTKGQKVTYYLFGGNILLASFWNKINLIKFAFFDFSPGAYVVKMGSREHEC